MTTTPPDQKPSPAERKAVALALAYMRGEPAGDGAISALTSVRAQNLPPATGELRRVVEAIDAIRDADGAPPPTFAEQAESGLVSWTDAARRAREWQSERAAAIKRSQNGAIQVVNHWGVIQTIRDHLASPYVNDILAGLGDSDRSAINRILTELNG